VTAFSDPPEQVAAPEELERPAPYPAAEQRTELAGRGRLYRRSTVYLTGQQYAWLRSIVEAAAADGLPMSASDVVRLALDQLREEPRDLRARLIAHIHEEVVSHPGRLKRGLPAGGRARSGT
jgi:Arc/MetJ-type ribon-helix-helix transcriptional regulator